MNHKTSISKVYCILSLFKCMICQYCLPALRDIIHTPMTRYSLFVLKVPLNTKQTNKQVTCSVTCARTHSLHISQ